jgi:hypothetical protein
MKKLETTFDDLLGCNYSLYSVRYSELMDTVKSWYDGYNLKEFDNRFTGNPRYEVDFKVMRKSGLLTNLFYAYKEEDKFYLLDGFNRLLANYGELDKNTTVYIKIIEDKLEDFQLMSLMFNLNLWKLYNENYGGFTLKDFIDRGFRLFLKSKFNVELYYCKTYDERVKYKDDIRILEEYFINEDETSGNFKYDYKHVARLFLNENLLGDFRDLLLNNNYLKQPFSNFHMFLEGYAKFLSWRRLNSDNTQYKFIDFLEILYRDKVFFKKLQGMSGNDSTRKNIYKFFRNTYTPQK